MRPENGRGPRRRIPQPVRTAPCVRTRDCTEPSVKPGLARTCVRPSSSRAYSDRAFRKAPPARRTEPPAVPAGSCPESRPDPCQSWSNRGAISAVKPKLTRTHVRLISRRASPDRAPLHEGGATAPRACGRLACSPLSELLRDGGLGVLEQPDPLFARKLRGELRCNALHGPFLSRCGSRRSHLKKRGASFHALRKRPGDLQDINGGST